MIAATACLAQQLVRRRDYALRQAVDDDASRVVDICLPCWRAAVGLRKVL